MSDVLTPMLRQYREIKEQHPDCLLFYRIGDFYEMFYEDAVVASKVLDIVLTSRNKNDPNPIPLCGVPHHSCQPYLEKLIEKGFKVAICDQVEDPKSAKGVVRREVVRVVTPGLTDFWEGKEGEGGDHYLVAVAPGKGGWGIALLGMVTGDFRVTEVEGGEEILLEELRRLHPREILISDSLKREKGGEATFLFSSFDCLTTLPDWVWDEAYARKILYDQFKVATLSGFHCEGVPLAVVAAGAALHYAKETQRVASLPHVTSLRRYERSEAMILGEESRNNLSLDDLIEFVDETETSLGYRRLREWFYFPLLQKGAIEKRLDAVEELVQHPQLLEGLKQLLKGIYDLERISSRLALGTAHARDLLALGDSLQRVAEITPLLSELRVQAFQTLFASWDSFPELRDLIDRTLVEDPPLALKEGNLIREGIHSELDELRKLRSDAKGAMAAMEERERQRTGIASLKIRFNQVFGYYLEVSGAQLSKVPPDFIRRQTLANAERFITPELKAFEDKILGAEERIQNIEYRIFSELRDYALASVPPLKSQAERVGCLDALLSLASYARNSQTVRPRIEESGLLKIQGGRHPLVEKSLPTGTFVPNDLRMDVEGERFLVITGPNMAGKSTVIRMVGVIVLMAQVGSFVPACEATIGLVDQLFTRVGAADRLARGESTFMVEMCETAAILHHATEKSLVLLDEIGRGTSTFDGISIAWAVAEYLHDTIRARTLFATHYHELTDLSLTRPGIKNYNVQVKEEGEEVVFLYRLVAGGMSRSFGIHVAKLAGLPAEVIDRSREVLKNLEQGELEPGGVPRLGKKRKKDESHENQGTLF